MMFLLSHMCLALSQHHAAHTRCLVQLKYSLLHDPHITKSKLSNELEVNSKEIIVRLSNELQCESIYRKTYDR